jgi:hypothetical protein
MTIHDILTLAGAVTVGLLVAGGSYGLAAFSFCLFIEHILDRP